MKSRRGFRLLLTLCLLWQSLPASAVVPLTTGRASRPRTATQRLAERGDAEGPLAQSVWGFCAVNLKGDTLVWLNPGRRMVPASNLKLITTGTALLALGGGHRFTTTLATDALASGADAAIQPESCPAASDTLHGNLYIIGGGDPLIGEVFPYLPSPDETFGKWSKVLTDNGIRVLDGDIIGIGSYFSAPQCHGDWSSEDLLSRDGVVPSGLTWRGRMGDSIPDGPASAALHYLRWLQTSPDSPVAIVPSPVQPGCDASPVLPVSDLASLPSQTTAPDSLRILGTIESLPLRELVRIANSQSDNFIAETLLKEMGKRNSGDDGYKASIDAMRRALSPLGLMAASGQMRFADGSGLSRKNYVSPAFMASYLRAMSRSRAWQDFLYSLPFPGEKNTTLENRLPGRPYALRHRIRMKSGSMNGVRCFSGYILPSGGKKENTIVFSILTNNAVAQGSQVYQLIDAMLESLANEN